MITSITIIKDPDTKYRLNPGSVTITGGDNITVEGADNTIRVGLGDISGINKKYTDYIKKLESVTNFPFVSSVSNVRGNKDNNLWLLGDKTAQIDVSDDGNGFTLCDMSQTVDYPRIYRSVYAMLRQLRLWIDAHKDSLLLKNDDAEKSWTAMLQDPGDWSTSDSDTMFKETRLRSEIPALGPALNLLNEYKGTVALWNHVAELPASSVSVRLHPADASGLYIGANIIVPITEKRESDITVTFTIELNGQSGDNMYMWLRVPVAKSIPDISKAPVITFPTSAEEAVSGEASILDEGMQVKYSGGPLNVITKVTIPEDNMETSYTIQAVLEAIPFFLCSDKEKTYVDSKKADHFSALGENTWTILTTVELNGTNVQDPIEETKKTAYTSVCEDPEESESDTGNNL